MSKFRTVPETLHSLFQMHDLSSQIADRLVAQLDILSQIRDCLATLRTIHPLRSDACREYAGVQRRGRFPVGFDYFDYTSNKQRPSTVQHDPSTDSTYTGSPLQSTIGI